MIVSSGGDAHAQQALIIIHGLDDRHQEEQELGVFIRRLTRAQKVHALVRRHGPVVVLAAAVDTGEGFFMQQTDQVVLPGDLLHDLHGQLVVVGSDVGGREDRRQLMLTRSNFVMLGLGVDAQLPELLVQFFHEGLDPRLDGAEVMVVKLLALGRFGAEKRPAGIDQVLPFQVHVPVHQEVLLLGTHVGDHPLDIRVAEELQDPHGLLVQGFHTPQQRGFLIQRLTAVGAESSRDAERLLFDEGIGSGVPGRVSSRLEGGTQAAGGEAGGIRFAGDEVLSGELHDHVAVRRRRDEAVVLLRGDAGQRLEPVCEVRRPVLHGPLAHRVRDGVGEGEVELLALVHGVAQTAIDIRRESGAHDLVVKYHASKQFRYRAHDHSSKRVLLTGRHRLAEASSGCLRLPICAYLTLWCPLCQDESGGFFV